MRASFRLLLATLASLAAGPGAANDSTAVMEAGGLRLTRDTPVVMEREDLFVPVDRISVDYLFRADDPNGVTTLVAFPLPDYDLAWMGPQVLSGPGVGVGDQTAFRVWQDGTEIAPALEVKALRNGIDVTALVEAAGIPPATLDYDAIVARLRALSPDLKAQFRDADLARFWDEDYDPEPLWTIKATYFWTQTFPPGRAVAIRHEYVPIAGAWFVSTPAPPELDPALWCMGPAEIEGVRQRAANDVGIAVVQQVRYILTTGGNWNGPIGTFHLTVDKGKPSTQVSLCQSGLKKTAPTRFEVTLHDYTPTDELDVLFVAAPE